jgi:two-component system, sensor histidine kinase and response regulator
MTHPAERILIADDNQANREVLEAHLVAAGFEVIKTNDGLEAVEAFGREVPDMVILDLLMPRLDGFGACRRIRETEPGSSVPILFLTALGDLETHQRALKSGADDFLTKPIQRTELLIRVRSLLRIRRLYQELQASNEELRAQRDALAEAKRLREEFTAFLLHDLKNPLQTIMLGTQSIARDEGINERSRRALQRTTMALETLQQMVLNLLDISRSEEGTLVLERTEVDVAELAGEVATLMRPRAAAEGKHLEVDASGVAGLAVQLDREMIRRVLMNLLDNAVKHTPPASRVALVARAEPGGLLFCVQDEGPGIPEAQRERVFQKYVKLAEGGVGGSRGLGLAFSRLAVEAHGGRIWAEQNQPTGSLFKVRLPRA